MDKEIFQAVRQQSGTTARSKQDLGLATGQITELFGKVGWGPAPTTPGPPAAAAAFTAGGRWRPVTYLGALG